MKAIQSKAYIVQQGRHQMLVVTEKRPLCVPSAGLDFAKINIRKSGNGVHKLPVAEAGIDLSARANSYNDYIHFNYGPVEKRYYSANGT